MTYVERLRALADWYEAHPDVPTPYLQTENVFLETRDDLVKVAHAAGGRLEKGETASWFYLRLTTDAFTIEFNVPRERVCVRRIVATRDVPEQIIAAHTEDVVEWDCAPILAEDGGVIREPATP